MITMKITTEVKGGSIEVNSERVFSNSKGWLCFTYDSPSHKYLEYFNWSADVSIGAGYPSIRKNLKLHFVDQDSQDSVVFVLTPETKEERQGILAIPVDRVQKWGHTICFIPEKEYEELFADPAFPF